MAQVSPEVAHAISCKKARYCRYADTKQLDKFEPDIALPDAQWSFWDKEGKLLVIGDQVMEFDSTKKTVAFFSKFFAPLDTLHNICPGSFEQVAPDEVNAIFGFEDQLMHKKLGAWAEMRGGGFYNETWKLVDGQWYLKEMRLERTYHKMSVFLKIIIFIAGLLGVSLSS
ncbi:hypothetical protein EDB81DRAFT_808457 [Dactylonectria macrodidyma]|uniref:SnoaL-like domain-containing protein n=1 Tax=Dactylonectria macrodidyma TaxID=307937 RepID=A0A9P9IRY2_9HYPO|nr:hypothetical protein EDB81DRAFT_808457 [Dactylonectria macrodidyma]